jgi:hypothetical protein
LTKRREQSTIRTAHPLLVLATSSSIARFVSHRVSRFLLLEELTIVTERPACPTFLQVKADKLNRGENPYVNQNVDVLEDEVRL